MRATKKPVERLQNLYRVLGTYGGKIVANDPEDFNPITFEIGSVMDDTARAMIGLYRAKELLSDDDYAIRFFLELKFCGDEIKTVEIKGAVELRVIWKLEVDEYGITYMDGKCIGKTQNLNNMLQRFLRTFEPVIFYIQRNLATVIKYEEPADAPKIILDIKEIDE